MEKEVVIQLKVQRPRDQAAWAETTRVASALETKFKSVGAAGGKALSDVSAKAQRLAADSKKSSEAVTTLMRELAKGNREALGIERISRQLRSMGVDATRASEAAARLMRNLGSGARLAEGDLRRLATTMRATGGGSGGIFRRIGGALGQPLANTSLGRFGAFQLGGQVLGSAGQAVRQSLTTSADSQIQEMLRDRRQGFGAGSSFLTELHSGVPLLGGVRDFFTHDARQGVADSERRLQRNLQSQEFARQQRQIRGAGRAAELAAQSSGSRDFALAGVGADAGIIGARESVGQFRADRRLDDLQQRLALQMEAVGRGERLGGGVIDALRGEVANRPAFGGAERFRIGAERGIAQEQLAAGRSRLANATDAVHAGGDVSLEQVAARQQIVEAQQRLVELERRDVELTRQSAEAEQQRLERFRQFAQTAEEGYRRIAQQERDRVSSFREQFGLMNELDRAQLRQLAGRARGSGIQSLSGEELQRLQGSGLFGEQIRAEASRRAELSGVQGIIQASGVEGRISAAQGQQAQAAQIRTQIENQITVNMTASAEDMARQISRQLQPAIAQLTVEIVAGVRAQLTDALAEAERQRVLQNAQGRPGS